MLSYNFIVIPPVRKINQGRNDLCWLATTAALFSWKKNEPVSMSDAANLLGIEYALKYKAGTALNYDELRAWTIRAGFRSEAQQCIAPSGWEHLLRNHGPLIALVDGARARKINHAVVVYGITGDGSSSRTILKVMNGQGGTLQDYSLIQFASVFELPPGTDALFSVSYFQ